MTCLRDRSRILLPLLALLFVALAVLVVACTGGEAGSTTSSGIGTQGPGSETSGAVSETVTTGPTPPTTGATPPTAPNAVPPSTPPTPPNAAPPSAPPSSDGGVGAEQKAELEATVQQNPTDREALEQLGIAYYQAKQYDKAEATYLRRLDLGDSAEIHNNLGNVYRDWGKREQAIAEYEKAMKLDPSLVYPYSNLAGLYMMTGDTKRAIEIAQAGIEKTTGAAREQLQALLDTLK